VTRCELARIGPNAVIQTLRALDEVPGRAEMVARRAGLEPKATEGMIPEAWFVRLLTAVRQTLPADEAEAVLADSGRRTAEYVATHRIPRLFRVLLRRLPPRLGVPLMLRAFARHAWTFAGAGRFEAEGDTIVLRDAPTCRGQEADHALGAYYAAAFEGLLSVAAPDVRVHETHCQAQGADGCHFHITLES